MICVGHACGFSYDMLLCSTIAAHTHHQSCRPLHVLLLVFHLVIHLLPHSEGHLPQCQFSQLQYVGGIEEVVQGCLYLFFGIYLASFQAFHQFLGSEVYVHHLVGFTEYAVGDALLHFHTHHLLHLIVQTLEVLDVDSRNHIDTGIEQFHHVLPSFGMAATFHIGVGQFVHYHYLGVHLQDGIQVHLLYLFPLVEYLLAWDYRQTSECLHRIGPAMCLHISYLHVRSLPEHLACIL